ncbi:MAG: class I SAM-dependent methyltransferase [Pseudomonadota bacterium]
MPSCRFCAAPLSFEFVDLGATPLANSYLPMTEEARAAEKSFPLRVMVCTECWLVQTTETVPADEIFAPDYAYLSSFSSGWVAHARAYAEAMQARFSLGPGSKVVEIASNDGYLLQWFVKAGIPVLGVEPAAHAATLAEEKGAPTRVAFFGEATAEELRAEGHGADLMAANNVLAHVPDIRDFAQGFAVLLKPQGVATFEFPHLACLIRDCQFDTIYHEHYSYLSLVFVERLFGEVGLEVFDVERLPTHGGSLRLFVGHAGAHTPTVAVADLRAEEAAMGLASPAPYAQFAPRVAALTGGLRDFIRTARDAGNTVAGYGAPAKGNTFLNVAGLTAADIAFTVDRNPEKQGMLLPGSHIPVHPPERIAEARPDYLLILPWNIADEVMAQQAILRDWGGQFVVAAPELRIF